MAALLLLTACGGGSNNNGGSSSGSGNGGSTSGNGGNNGGVRTMKYEALSAPSDSTSFLAQLNAEGAKGFRYIAEEAYSGENNAIYNVFVNDNTDTYSYEFQAANSTQAGFLAQANSEGAKGFRYEGPLTFGNLYRHDGASSATYTYAAQAEPTSSAAFLSQANAQGQNGFWYYGPMQLDGAATAVYMKDGTSSSTYTYDALGTLANSADFVTQANGEGAKGYRFKGGMAFGSDTVELYVKDATQSSSFTYQSQTLQTTSATFIQQANAQGAQSEAYLGDLVFGATPTSFYFLSTACTGFLCSSLNTFTQN